MEFASILDGMARRAPDEGAAGRPGQGGGDFWRVLDGLERDAGIDRRATHAAYRANGAGEGPQAPSPDRPAATASLSIDPDDIAFELALSAATSLEDLKTARRLFARANHPDRVPASERERANRRMTIANALVDEAAERFAR